MSSASITPISLTGTSQYASTYQSILTQSLQVAEVPLTALQTQDSNILSQKTLLSGLSSAAGNLANDLQALGATASRGALSAISSDSSTVSVTDTGATAAASYTINSVTSAAAAASEVSTTSYADASSTPVSSTGSLNLVVGTKTYPITLSNNSLTGLKNAINGLGAGVTASILTTGSGGDYLSVSANSTGATTLQLNDDPTGANTDLLTGTNQGTNAVFYLSGIKVSQPSNTVANVIPGLTFTIEQPSTTPVTLSVQGDASQLSSTLTSFVSDFNSLQQLLSAQKGPAAGALAGDNVVTGLQATLNQLASFHSGTGTVNNLSDLGVTFNDTTGALSFDPSVLNSFDSAQFNSALTYIGSPTSGLAELAGSLTQFSDPVSGSIQIEQQSINTEDQQLQAELTTKTNQINAQQTALSQQLAKADAHQSLLQSQQSELTATLQGLDLVLYGPTPTN